MAKGNAVQSFLRILQTEGGAPKALTRIDELIELGSSLGAPEMVLGNLGLYREARVAADEAEARAKGLREEAGEAWRKLLRSMKGEELDLFEEVRSEKLEVRKGEDEGGVADLCEDLIDRGLMDPVRIERLKGATADQLECVLEVLQATRGGDLTYGDCLNVVDIAGRIDALCSPSMGVKKAHPPVCAMVREARHRAGLLHPLFACAEADFQDELDFGLNEAVDAIIGLLRLVKIVDLPEDQISRLATIEKALSSAGYAIPDVVRDLFGWVARYRKQQAQELEDGRRIPPAVEAPKKKGGKASGKRKEEARPDVASSTIESGELAYEDVFSSPEDFDVVGCFASYYLLEALLCLAEYKKPNYLFEHEEKRIRLIEPAVLEGEKKGLFVIPESVKKLFERVRETAGTPAEIPANGDAPKASKKKPVARSKKARSVLASTLKDLEGLKSGKTREMTFFKDSMSEVVVRLIDNEAPNDSPYLVESAPLKFGFRFASLEAVAAIVYEAEVGWNAETLGSKLDGYYGGVIPEDDLSNMRTFLKLTLKKGKGVAK